MIEIDRDDESFNFNFNEHGELYNLAQVIEHCFTIWPGIEIGELNISSNAYVRYTGDDIYKSVEISASPSYFERMKDN